MPLLPKRISFISALKVLMKSVGFGVDKQDHSGKEDMNSIWIESINSFEIQVLTELLQIDNARFSEKIQSQMDQTNDFYMES